MSIMEKIFGQFNKNPANAGSANPPKGPETQSGPKTEPNGVVPPNSGEPPQSDPPSPVAKFEDLWQPNKTDPADQNSKSPEPNQMDPQKMMEAAAKVDFSKVINQEDLSKIQAGGQEAVQALVNALNKTSQTVFGQATIVAQKLIDKRVQETRDELEAQIPSMVRKQSARDGLFEENPAFSNPAVSPFIETLQERLSEKYPKATPGEIQTMAKEYLSGVANLINPPTKSTNQFKGSEKTRANVEVDWEDYLK
jgi:hypothetical protein